MSAQVLGGDLPSICHFPRISLVPRDSETALRQVEWAELTRKLCREWTQSKVVME